jgi:DNA-binding MarR family transcriptional regulator
MKTTNKTVIHHLQRVINKILFLKKKNLFQFQGVKFYPSEVHVMLVIEEKRATNATRMAEQLGVTKGAVSQTLTP